MGLLGKVKRAVTHPPSPSRVVRGATQVVTKTARSVGAYGQANAALWSESHESRSRRPGLARWVFWPTTQSGCTTKPAAPRIAIVTSRNRRSVTRRRSRNAWQPTPSLTRGLWVPWLTSIGIPSCAKIPPTRAVAVWRNRRPTSRANRLRRLTSKRRPLRARMNAELGVTQRRGRAPSSQAWGAAYSLACSLSGSWRPPGLQGGPNK